VDKLSDEGLILAFRRALAHVVPKALRIFAQAIVARPTVAERPERLRAYSVLAQTTPDFGQAMKHVEEGRDAALKAGHSCASWDLLELSLNFGRGDGHEAMRLVQHIQQRHMQEQGVARALTQMLIDVGLLQPDGTPAVMPSRQAADGAMPGAPPAEASKLWTPGCDEPSGGGGKIWTPG
jgi:hypothetical protein